MTGEGVMTETKVKELFSNLKPERRRNRIPKRIIDLAIKEVDKIKDISFKHKEYDNIFWGDNPIKETPLTINLPHIEINELIDVPEDFVKNAVFYDAKKVKSQKIKIVKDSCVITHKGEIMIVYITSKTDKAILKATERVSELAKGLDKYYPVKEDTFYTPFLLTKADATKEEKQKATKYKTKQASVSRYTGKNWMDGMIKYFIGLKGSKGGTMVAYQPRSPDAGADEQFLYDLIYTYMALYELEKRYTPDIAKYRLKLATDAGFPGAFPGVPLSRHCSTGVGGSYDFSSAIHNDSGIQGLTETIIWNKPRNNEKQYFVSPTIKMCFDLTDNKAIIFQPPKIPHSTLQTGEHNGIGLVNITKQNLVAKTDINKQYYDLWKKSFEGRGINNNYVIAIPSYFRQDELKNKTLKLLLSRHISPSSIYIFVANKDEYKKYQETIPKDMYNEMIIGKKGIANQRNFMIEYFKEGEKIVFIDDDITNIGIKKGNKFGDAINLDSLFKNWFDMLNKNNKYLWATTNMTNPFFKTISKDKSTIGLLPFSGDLFGIINRKSMKLKYTLKKGEGEQTELSLMYQKKDAGILLLNNVVVFSGKLTKGGKEADRNGIENRKKDWDYNVKVLGKHYKEFIDSVETPEHSTRAMIKFKKLPIKEIKGGMIRGDDESKTIEPPIQPLPDIYSFLTTTIDDFNNIKARVTRNGFMDEDSALEIEEIKQDIELYSDMIRNDNTITNRQREELLNGFNYVSINILRFENNIEQM